MAIGTIWLARARRLGVVFCVALLLTVCAITQGGLAKTKVVFWTNHHMEHDPNFERVIAEFEAAHPEIEVEWRNVVDGGSVNYYDVLTVAFLAGNAPDVFYVRPGTDVDLVANNWVYDIHSLVERDAVEIDVGDFIPAQVSELQYKGRWWALPYDFSAGGLYYNQDLFDGAGLPYPSPASTWDDIVDAAQKLTRRSGDQVTTWGMNGIEWLFSPWSEGHFLSFGGRLFDETLTKSMANDPNNELALQLPVTLVHELEVAAPFTVPGYHSLFFDGRAAMTLDGSWNTTTHRAYNQFRFDVSSMPLGPAGLTVSATGGAWAISSVTEAPEEAWALLKALAGESAVRTLIVEPVRSLPPRVSLMNDWADAVREAGAPASARLLAQQVLDHGKAVPVVGFPFNQVFYRYHDDLLAGRRSPAEVIERIHHDFTVEFSRLQ